MSEHYFRIIYAHLLRKAGFFHDTELAKLQGRVRDLRMREFGTEKELREHVESLAGEIPVERLYTKGLQFYDDPLFGRRLALDVSHLNLPVHLVGKAKNLGRKYLNHELHYDPRHKKLWVASIFANEDVVLYLQEKARAGTLSEHDLRSAKKLVKLIQDLNAHKDQILKELAD